MRDVVPLVEEFAQEVGDGPELGITDRLSASAWPLRHHRVEDVPVAV